MIDKTAQSTNEKVDELLEVEEKWAWGDRMIFLGGL